MGFRFRRSIKILPGIRLYIGRRGVSTSLGVRGAHITVGHGQVRETVELPGTGLSYTHVSKTDQGETSHVAPSAPPPTVATPSAARGWLWIAVIVFVVAVATWLLASCDSRPAPPTAQAAAPTVSVAAKPDPRIAYELDEKCGRNAREWFKHFFEDDHTPNVTSSYANHYNTAKNRCIVLVSTSIYSKDKKTGKVRMSQSGDLTDVLENRDFGSYFKSVDTGHFLTCSVNDKPCTSTDEWDALAKPYMEQ